MGFPLTGISPPAEAAGVLVAAVLAVGVLAVGVPAAGVLAVGVPAAGDAEPGARAAGGVEADAGDAAGAVAVPVTAAAGALAAGDAVPVGSEDVVVAGVPVHAASRAARPSAVTATPERRTIVRAIGEAYREVMIKV